jgi:hypothetical protein
MSAFYPVPKAHYTIIMGRQRWTFTSKRAALAHARQLGGKRIRRAKATPPQLTYYALPDGAQLCLRKDEP